MDHPALYDIAARMRDRWEGRVGHTLRSDMDGFVMLGEALLRVGAPELSPEQAKTLRRWIRETLTPQPVRDRLAKQQAARDEKSRRPGIQLNAKERARRRRTDADRDARRAARATADATARCFYDRHGMRWDDIDAANTLRIIARLRKRVDGTPGSHNTVARRVITANATLDWAVRRDLLRTGNPMRSLEDHQRPSTSIKIRPVDLRLVIPISTIAIVDACRRLGRRATRQRGGWRLSSRSSRSRCCGPPKRGA